MASPGTGTAIRPAPAKRERAKTEGSGLANFLSSLIDEFESTTQPVCLVQCA
jgi:hypothetical protein